MAGTLTFGELRGAPAGTAWWNHPAVNRVARHPAIRLAILAAQADANTQEMINDPGLQAANAALAHPAAQHIMNQTDLLWGRTPYEGAIDVGLAEALYQRSYMASDMAASSAYGISLQPNEVYPALSAVLSTAAGRPIDASTVTPAEAMEILEGYQADLDEEVSPSAVSEVTAGNVSIVRREADEIDCFEVPEGADPEEFEQQLQEQEDEINNTDIETLQRRRAEFQNGDARRDHGAQREARRRWVSDRTRELMDTEQLSRTAADAQARREAAALDATHVLDMVAGGAADLISGLGKSRINRSIGSQWKGRRVGQLDALLERQRREGRTKPKVELEVCD